MDAEQIQSLIDAKKDRISNLVSQIQGLTRVREVAEIRELALLQLMISPIGKLPTELLANIFHLVVPPEGFRSDCPEDYSGKIIAEALRVSQVCRYWREMAHSTPRLQQLAQRSHPLPITIYFWSGAIPANGAIFDFRTTDMFKKLISTTSRWGHAIWHMPSLSPLSELAPGSFPALERINIESLDIETPEKAIDAFKTAPLREFEICVRQLDGHRDILQLFHVPWNQLTFLVLEEDLDLNDCLEILLKCSNLISTRICSHGWNLARGAIPPPAIVILPCLDVLDLAMLSGGAEIEPLLAALALPALKSLKLFFDGHNPISWDSGIFSEFQDRSPNIEKIEIEAERHLFTAENFIALLRHAPLLIHFTTTNCTIEDAVLRALQYNKTDPQSLVPSLMILNLDGIGDEVSDGALVDMIRSQWWPDEESSSDSSVFEASKSVSDSLSTISCLEQVTISRKYTFYRSRDDDGISKELRTSLEILREEGLSVGVY